MMRNGGNTWADHPKRDEYRAMNGGMGCCNTGSGMRGHCVLMGIGCDVDQRLDRQRQPSPTSRGRAMLRHALARVLHAVADRIEVEPPEPEIQYVYVYGMPSTTTAYPWQPTITWSSTSN